MNFLLPIGRSVYNALDLKLVQNISNPLKGIKNVNLQVAYSLSKFVNPGGANPNPQPANFQQGSDQDFVIGAADNANPLRFMGPSTLDRTHQLSFGGSFDLPWGFQTGIIGHFYSPLSTPLVVPNSGLGDGEIFRTDFTGDGSVQDYVPGTKNGSFMRGISIGDLHQRRKQLQPELRWPGNACRTDTNCQRIVHAVTTPGHERRCSCYCPRPSTAP